VSDGIRAFLREKCLLITGATGFLGKPLVEKTLRAVPDVKRIYLLIRAGENADGERVGAQERFEREIVASGAFNRLKEEWGRDFDARVNEKVRVLEGDIAVERLGLSESDYAEVTANVRVVINAAAVVVFDERLDVAVELNALAPRRLVEFVQTCPNALLVHVSTAYVNGQNPDVAPEALLPTDADVPVGWRGPVLPTNLDDEIAVLKQLCLDVERESLSLENRRRFEREAQRLVRDASRKRNEKAIGEQAEQARQRWLKERLIHVGMERAKARGWNDTYTFTKAMGERIVALSRGDLPTAIIRPSIIEGSLAEPEPGWIDGYRMADPIIVAFGKGRVPDFPANPEIVMDLIPVDFVVNAILGAIPDLAEKRGLQIYHVASGTQNPLYMRDLYAYTREHFRRNPMLDKNGHPIPIVSWSFPPVDVFRRRLRRRVLIPLRALIAFAEWLPTTRRVRRWRLRLNASLNAAERLDYYTVIYGPYILHTYLFDTRRTQSLFESLSSVEKALYPFDATAIDWRTYVDAVHIPGLKRNVLKMNPERVKPPIAEEEILDERAHAVESAGSDAQSESRENDSERQSER
jgi:nucleoside-diphosphate-sugar epimerase